MSGESKTMQKQYWDYMVQIKAWIFYLDVYIEKSYRWDKGINIIGAIASSSSIGAWAIWQKLSWIWGIIIAISQVIAAVKPYLPFNRRMKILTDFMSDLKNVYNKLDYNWYKVSSGELSENEINELLARIKQEYTNLESMHLKEETLVENKKIQAIADEKTNIFFERYLMEGQRDE